MMLHHKNKNISTTPVTLYERGKAITNTCSGKHSSFYHNKSKNYHMLFSTLNPKPLRASRTNVTRRARQESTAYRSCAMTMVGCPYAVVFANTVLLGFEV